MADGEPTMSDNRIVLDLTDAEVFILSEALRVARGQNAQLLGQRIDNPSASARWDKEAIDLLLNRQSALSSLNRKVTAAVLHDPVFADDAEKRQFVGRVV